MMMLLMLLQTAETPLHIAARVDDGEKCAEILIKSGADSNASQQVRGGQLQALSLIINIIIIIIITIVVVRSPSLLFH